eukprot:531898-Prymnesium_polylepis.1
MVALLKTCTVHTRDERYNYGHSCPPCESVPRPCTAPGCTFAHNTATAATEHAELLKEEARLESDKTKKGKAAFS